MGPDEKSNKIFMIDGTPIVYDEIPEIDFEFTDSAWCECPLSIPRMFTGSMHMRKYSRKKFKKYLMSLGCSRDFAEKQCNIVASHKGVVSYNMMVFWSVLFGN